MEERKLGVWGAQVVTIHEVEHQRGRDISRGDLRVFSESAREARGKNTQKDHGEQSQGHTQDQACATS